jgi:Uma2 family endonuclease
MLTEKTHLTPAEYLALERQSQERHEYYGGELRLMAGASRKHNIIAGNLFAVLHQQLRSKPCRPFMSDMRVWIASAQRYFYPDIAVICGTEPFVEEDVATDATVIIEVLSETTEAFDRGEKFESYQRLPSHSRLCDSLAKRTCELNIFINSLTTNGDTLLSISPMRFFNLMRLAFRLPLKEIYA